MSGSPLRVLLDGTAVRPSGSQYRYRWGWEDGQGECDAVVWDGLEVEVEGGRHAGSRLSSGEARDEDEDGGDGDGDGCGADADVDKDAAAASVCMQREDTRWSRQHRRC